jgi:hypothetical protein
MTVEHDRDHFNIVCDTCGEAYASARDNFRDTWSDAKRDGWRAHYESSVDWTHTCPDCASRKEIKSSK